MLHGRCLEIISRNLRGNLEALVASGDLDLDPEEASTDLARFGIRIDLSRSAARLRRQVYWFVKSPLVLTEFVALGDDGWGPRKPMPGPAYVGDVCVQQLTLVRVARGYKGPAGRDAQGAIKVLSAVLSAVASASKLGLREPTPDMCAVLVSLHMGETARRIKKSAVVANAERHFRQMGLPDPAPKAVEAAVKQLAKHRFVSDEEGRNWKLNRDVKWTF